MVGIGGENFDAVIFDMDGVIIDTGYIWKKAEHEVFSSVGVTLSDELCDVTERMTTEAVTSFWYSRQPWEGKSLKEVEACVIERVAFFIEKEGTAVPGIENFIERLSIKGYKVGLATNSPYKLIPVVLDKLGFNNYFDAVSSAENEIAGKPDPSVYLSVAGKLNVDPASCLAIDDSTSGIVAAKKAGMKAIYLSQGDTTSKFADHIINDYAEIDYL